MRPVLELTVSARVDATALRKLGISKKAFAVALSEMVLADAKRRTPVRTGALRNSGSITKVDESGFQVAFGGPAAPYAVFVHEDLKARHRVGEAKFLEKAMFQIDRFARELLR